MAFTADLHPHSRYAYGCSKDLILANMAVWAKVKGIELVSTSDFIHRAWLSELESNRVSTQDGGFLFKGVRFVLGRRSAVFISKVFDLEEFICWSARRRLK